MPPKSAPVGIRKGVETDSQAKFREGTVAGAHKRWEGQYKGQDSVLVYLG